MAEFCLNKTWSFAGQRREHLCAAASVSHRESIRTALAFAGSVAYECIVPFLLTPCLLNQGNGTGRKSRSHPHPEAGSATTVLADRNATCLKTTNEPPLLFSFANLTIQFLQSFLIGQVFRLAIFLVPLWSFSKRPTSFLKGSVQNWS